MQFPNKAFPFFTVFKLQHIVIFVLKTGNTLHFAGYTHLARLLTPLLAIVSNHLVYCPIRSEAPFLNSLNLHFSAIHQIVARLVALL